MIRVEELPDRQGHAEGARGTVAGQRGSKKRQPTSPRCASRSEGMSPDPSRSIATFIINYIISYVNCIFAGCPGRWWYSLDFFAGSADFWAEVHISREGAFHEQCA